VLDRGCITVERIKSDETTHMCSPSTPRTVLERSTISEVHPSERARNSYGSDSGLRRLVHKRRCHAIHGRYEPDREGWLCSECVGVTATAVKTVFVAKIVLDLLHVKTTAFLQYARPGEDLILS
jgi:hypothetical protein